MKRGIKTIKRGGREYFLRRPAQKGHVWLSCIGCAFHADPAQQDVDGACKLASSCGDGRYERVIYRCPNCNSSNVWAQTELHLNTRRPNPKTIKLDYAFCNNCGESNRPKKCKR